MVLVRLALVIVCVLLWATVTGCASADPVSQPASSQTEPRKSATQNVASLTALSPTATSAGGAVSAGVAKSSATANESGNATGMTTAQVSHSSPTAGPALATANADSSDSELDCTDEANRCDPACLTAVPSSRFFLPNVGDEAYGFDLPSAAGQTYSLAAYRDESNVVLVFYRAFW